MRGIRQWHRYYLPATLLLLLVILSIFSEYFLTVANFRNVLYQVSVLAIVSIGMTFVVIGGGFDLSVGSLLALAGSLAALVMSEAGLGVGLLAGVLTGLLFGVANGLMVSRLLISPFIVTLGTLVVARGLALAITGGATVATVPEAFAYLGTGTVAGVPIPVAVTVAVWLAASVLLRFTPFGLKVYAVGGNREAARLAGIKVDRVIAATYVISGLLAALGGLIMAARVRSGQPTVGVFMELFAIAAVVLGGASLKGGGGGWAGRSSASCSSASCRTGSTSWMCTRTGSRWWWAWSSSGRPRWRCSGSERDGRGGQMMQRRTILTLGVMAELGLLGALLVGGQADAQRKFTVGVSLASSTNPFYIFMEQGMRERARELQAELRVVQAEEDQVRQLDGVQDLIQRKVDLILISPITATGAVPAYEAARAARIPVLSVARSVDPKHQVAFVGSDWVDQGRRIARWTVERLKGRGKVGMLLGPAGASFAQEMERGYKEVLARQPGMQVVAGHHSPLTRADGMRLAEDILTAHPDVAVLYGTNDELALGAVQAVKAQKKTGVIVTGFNGVPPAIEAVRKGELAMTIALKPKSWGRKAIEAAVDHLNGRALPKIVQIDTVVVDQTNVNRLKREDLL